MPELILLAAKYSSMVLAAYFVFILIFGHSHQKVHAFILSLFSFLGFLLPDVGSNSISDYVRACSASMMLDGATALVLTMFMVFDKLAWKQALLLAFAVLCHVMIIYDLTIESSVFSNFFYDWYDELIIAVGFLQMMVSFDGFARAFGNLRELLYRVSDYMHRVSQGLSVQEKGKDSS